MKSTETEESSEDVFRKISTKNRNRVMSICWQEIIATQRSWFSQMGARVYFENTLYRVRMCKISEYDRYWSGDHCYPEELVFPDGVAAGIALTNRWVQTKALLKNPILKWYERWILCRKDLIASCFGYVGTQPAKDCLIWKKVKHIHWNITQEVQPQTWVEIKAQRHRHPHILILNP